MKNGDPIDQIANHLGISVRFEGNARLVKAGDCLQIIQSCKSASVLILGIEAFRFVDGHRIPEMDLIADYSEMASKPWHEACADAARSARGFLERARGKVDLWMEFTLQAAPQARPEPLPAVTRGKVVLDDYQRTGGLATYEELMGRVSQPWAGDWGQKLERALMLDIDQSLPRGLGTGWLFMSPRYVGQSLSLLARDEPQVVAVCLLEHGATNLNEPRGLAIGTLYVK